MARATPDRVCRKARGDPDARRDGVVEQWTQMHTGAGTHIFLRHLAQARVTKLSQRLFDLVGRSASAQVGPATISKAALRFRRIPGPPRV
jgi:hypothetical protein